MGRNNKRQEEEDGKTLREKQLLIWGLKNWEFYDR